MANSRYSQFFYTKHKMPVIIDANVTIGSTGAVSSYAAIGLLATSGVVRNAAGIYQFNFMDNYTNFYQMDWDFDSPTSGSSILVASAGTVSGTTYSITIVGTTTTAGWQSLGLPVGITPAVGVAFKATATTTAAGTGAVQVPLATGSGIIAMDMIGNPALTVNPTPTPAGVVGGYVIARCLAATNSSTTTLVATDPASGSVLNIRFYMGMSSVSINSVAG